MKSEQDRDVVELRSRKINVLAIGVLILFAAGVIAAVALYGDGDSLGTTIFVTVIFFLAILSNFFKAVKDAVDRSFAAYMIFLGWMTLFVLPIAVINRLFGFILDWLPLIPQIIFFCLWGGILAFAIKLIATEKDRERLFYTKWHLAERIGSFAPVVYAFNLLMIAVIFFASVTFVLTQNAGLVLTGAETEKPSYDEIVSFYVWNFLEAVPLLKVNETLQRKQPLAYQSAWVGAVLLLFKLAVILPVIAAFAWYWKKISKHEESRSNDGNEADSNAA